MPFFLNVRFNKRILPHGKKRKIFWERPNLKINFDAIPFIYIGEKVYWCHQGKDKSAKKKSTKQTLNDIQVDILLSKTWLRDFARGQIELCIHHNCSC